MKGRQMALKNCKHCNTEFNSNKHMKNYCSKDCYASAYVIKDKLLEEKRVAKLNARFEGKEEGIDYISCPICHQKLREISNLHAKKHGFETPKDLAKAYNLEYTKCQSGRERMKGSNNPGYQHGGKLSPWSNKSGRTKEQIEESKQKAKDNSWGKNPAQLEYWINKHNGNKEEAQKSYAWHQSNGLKKMIHLYGEEEGTKRWKDRNEKWTAKIKNTTMFKTSAISKEMFSQIETNVPSILYGENEKVIRLNSSRNCRVDCLYDDGMKIIEFYGDYWHMNPKLYESTFMHTRFKKQASEVWESDEERIKLLKEKGYTVKIVWESEYCNNKEQVIKECIDFLNK